MPALLFVLLFWTPATALFALDSFGPAEVFSHDRVSKTVAFDHFSYVNPNAPKAGTLTLAGFGGYNNFNPYIMAGVNAHGLHNVYETLGISAANEENTIYGLVAESFQFDKKAGTLTILLRPNVRFHTGEAVNADDIIATYHTLIEFGHPAYAQRFSDIARVEKIDNLTVRFYANPDFKHDMPFNIASSPY